MEVHRGASSHEKMLALLNHEALQLNFFCECVDRKTIVMWPKIFGQVQGIQRMGDKSVCLYSPIEEAENTFCVSLWPIEILKDIGEYSKKVNPFANKMFAIFNLKADMHTFLQSQHFGVIKPGVIVTHGPLLPTTFKLPPGILTNVCKLVTVICAPCDGRLFWERLCDLAANQIEGSDASTKVKLCIRKSQWWQLSTEMLLDSSALSDVINIAKSMNLSWSQTELKQSIACLKPGDSLMEDINLGLKRDHSLKIGGVHIGIKSMPDFPKKLTPSWLQSLDYGFGQDMKILGIPVARLTRPASDIIFAALEQEEDCWKFLNETKDCRNLDPDDLTGVIISAILTKQYL